MRINYSLTIYVATFTVVLFASLTAIGQPISGPRQFRELHVLRSLIEIHSAQATYFSTLGNGNYGDLAALRQAGMIDGAIASGEKYGFVYTLVVSPYTPPNTPANYAIRAVPRIYRKSGLRSYFSDASGVIHGADKRGLPAEQNDPIIPYDPCTFGAASDNQRCTASDMRWLHGIQLTFETTSGNGSFGTFEQLHSVGLIRADFLDLEVRGYVYTLSTVVPTPGQSPARFRITAIPRTYPATGVFSFFIDETGVLRGGDKNGLPANENDPPIEN